MCTGWLISRNFFRVSMLRGLTPREMVLMFSTNTANWYPMGMPKNLSLAFPFSPKGVAGTRAIPSSLANSGWA
jgi:hypothetical protein